MADSKRSEAAKKAAKTRAHNREVSLEAKDQAEPVPGVDADLKDPNSPSHERDRLAGVDQVEPDVTHDTGQMPQPRRNPQRAPGPEQGVEGQEYDPAVQDAIDEGVARGPQAPVEEPEDATVFWDDSIHVDPRPVMPHTADTIAKDRARYDEGKPWLSDAPGEHPDVDPDAAETPAISEFTPFKDDNR